MNELSFYVSVDWQNERREREQKNNEQLIHLTFIELNTSADEEQND